MTYQEDLLDSPARLTIKVVPGASRTEVSEWLGDILKIRVAVQPEKGKANSEVVSLLARRLGLSRRSAVISSGKTSQQKIVEIHGLSFAEVKRKLGFTNP